MPNGVENASEKLWHAFDDALRYEFLISPRQRIFFFRETFANKVFTSCALQKNNHCSYIIRFFSITNLSI